MDFDELSHTDLDFEKFFVESKDRILRTVFVSTGNYHEAEDCVADAFEKAYRSWGKVGSLESPAAWVVRVATNRFIDQHRRRSRFAMLLPELARPEASITQPVPFDPDLLNAIRRLPVRQREVLEYRVILELSAKETARELSISVATVGVHLHRALQTLRNNVIQTEESDR
jgi:RNA polymerase sigma factor (sigma-70 family)